MLLLRTLFGFDLWSITRWWAFVRTSAWLFEHVGGAQAYAAALSTELIGGQTSPVYPVRTSATTPAGCASVIDGEAPEGSAVIHWLGWQVQAAAKQTPKLVQAAIKQARRASTTTSPRANQTTI